MLAIAREESVEPSMESRAARRCCERSAAEESAVDEMWKPVEAAKEICVIV
jgi:hypothetical protein